MAQDNPFAKYAQPQGDPVIAVDSYKQAEEARRQSAEQRAQEDQARQADAAARDDERLRMAQQDQARQAENDKFAGVEQSKAAAFLIRALGANDAYEAQDIEARSYIGQKMADNAPDVLNSLPASVGNSPRRQVSDATQDEFIAASLRQDSGAAIPPEEMARQRRIYFPMPGDDEATIAAKRQARQRAIEGLIQSSGKLAEGTIAKFKGMPKTPRADDASLLDELGLEGTVTDYGPPSGPGAPPPPDMGPDSLQGAGISAYDMQTDPGGYKSLAVQGATFGLSDEIAGVTGGIGSLLSGGNPVEGYTRRRDAERAKLDYYRKQSPILGTGAELLGGLATGGLAKAPASVAGYAAQGAGFGGLAGFGYGEGAANSGLNALIGAAGGGAIGGAVGKFAAPARNDLNMDVVRAGQRQNIPVRQADARPELRGQYAAAESTPNAGPLIQEARAADTAAIESRVAEIGGGPVSPDPYATGKTVQAAGQRYIAKTKQQANRLYNRAREASGDATVTARNADAVLDANIRELQAAGENSNKAAISYLQGLRDDIDRGLSLSSVQNLRTNMRGQISERGLTGTDTERRVGQVIDAMTQDLTEQLPQEASTALRAADKFYRERQEFINGTLKEFMGSRGNPLGAEQAATRLASMAGSKGKFDKFSSMWSQLEPSEQAEITKQIAYSLGRDGKGNFSPALFLNSLDPSKGMSPRAIRLVFGKEGAEALADLRTLTQAKGDAMSRMSPSGQAIAGQSRNLRTMIMAAFGFGAGDVTGAVAAPLAERFLTRFGEERAARMLLNPDFTKWLKNAPNTTNPKAIDRYFGRLAGMSSIAANDNRAFTQAIAEAVKQSPRRSAAEEENNAREKPPQ